MEWNLSIDSKTKHLAALTRSCPKLTYGITKFLDLILTLRVKSSSQHKNDRKQPSKALKLTEVALKVAMFKGFTKSTATGRYQLTQIT